MEDGTNWGWAIAMAALMWNLINSIWTRHVGLQNVTKQEIEEVKSECARIDKDVGGMREQLKQMPSKESVHSIDKAVTGMQGDLKAFNEQIKPIGRSLQRIEDYLMKKGQ